MGRGKSREPIGNGKAVEKHPLYEEIYELARSRFSGDSIVRLLQYRHAAEFEAGTLPPLPHARTVYRFLRERMPEKDVLPLRELVVKLNSLDRKVDLVEQLQHLYMVAEDRVARLMEMERPLPFPIPGLDKAVETLLKVSTQLWRVGQDLGMYPRSPGAWLTMGIKTGGGGMVLLQLGDGPPRQIDLASPDLASLPQEELDALRAMKALPAGKSE